MPVVVQDCHSGRVLMLGYMNQDALAQTLASKQVTFYSRTKNRLWTKGESSGHFLQLTDISTDCDNDTLLALVEPIGPTCHLGHTSCFNQQTLPDLVFLSELEQVIADRKGADATSSYTASLYASGTKRIAQKVGEEGVETALAATVHDHNELINESADLLYHLTVLLQQEELQLSDVIAKLQARHTVK
ncbi:bifunctional phosphoribosyl-AMP cyclohydrolase/phosphoribosyl-ATP diphosphatase HisIE [Oceanisphaera sp. DM8]|uniref:Histidine biosynthesis bifunctional protein HisIE n=2 Tax=Oceanisphaera pacifica TaxID=2818389 RepID=A0ABS3NFY0_9GAMM|nr:bifunctional phosphoribosyl-AMP cyclohydrolase/phosphoribosyl-ATP diphosphatase HisIE [Oceanisphaera pacifica]